MTHSQWKSVIQTKIGSSWNLHHLLPEDLDFFVLLSSLSGIYGSSGQSNYAAGCTYQDALAYHRILGGKKAMSLDVGWMKGIGIIAEKDDYRIVREKAQDMNPIEEDEFLALLDLCCDPSNPLPAPENAQLLLNPLTPADFPIKHGHLPPPQMFRPLFSGFERGMGVGDQSSDQLVSEDYAALFRDAASLMDRAVVVVRGLVAKLGRSLFTPPEDIDTTKSLSEFGVDSLMAVELRNWIGNDFQANVAVFDIMGSRAISAIGDLVAERSRLKFGEL